MISGLERSGQQNRYVNYRGEPNNLLSSYIGLVNHSPNPDMIWDEVKRGLIRLSASFTRDLRIASPHQVIEAVKLAESTSITKVATSLGRSSSEITRYRKVVGAIIVVALQREGMIPDSAPATDQQKCDQLKALQQEADLIGSVLGKKPVQKQLQQSPDLAALLAGFRRYSTVEPFLEENKVPYARQHISRFNASVRRYLFGSGVHLQIRPLLRKVTLSRWLYKGTNWHDRSEDEVSGVISRNAAFVYSAPASEDDLGGARSRYLKFFLEKIMAREFELIQQDRKISNYPLEEMFVPANGSITRPGEIDISATFSFFEDVAYCSEALRLFVREYIKRADSLQSLDYFALHDFRDSRYSLEYRRKWISAGLIFLENALFLQSRGEYPNWEDLNIDRRERLGEFRQLFQSYLAKAKRSVRSKV